MAIKVSITDPDDPLTQIVIKAKPRKVEAYAETNILDMINWFCVIAKITCKSKGKVDAGYMINKH